ncbi:MAG: diacylglycerol kinase family protein [Acidimicrobiia bacterium]|nr:diacylglycerol kinase family protein [Acidimicrobiia bacterium]
MPTALGMAGGDGSLGLVAEAAMASAVPFVCVPAGTRNHFARDLGLDRDDVVGALEAFVGERRRIDATTVRPDGSALNVTLGVYAEIVHQSGYRDNKLEAAGDVIPEMLDGDRPPTEECVSDRREGLGLGLHGPGRQQSLRPGERRRVRCAGPPRPRRAGRDGSGCLRGGRARRRRRQVCARSARAQPVVPPVADDDLRDRLPGSRAPGGSRRRGAVVRPAPRVPSASRGARGPGPARARAVRSVTGGRCSAPAPSATSGRWPRGGRERRRGGCFRRRAPPGTVADTRRRVPW